MLFKKYNEKQKYHFKEKQSALLAIQSVKIQKAINLWAKILTQ